MNTFDTTQPVFDVHFDSPFEYHEYMRQVMAHPQSNSHFMQKVDSEFGFYDRIDLSKIMLGCPDLAALVNSEVDNLTAQFPVTEQTQMIEADYIGFVPLIGAALCGDPKTMLRRKATESETIRAPLNILVNIGVSASVTAKQLVKRGVMIAALALLAVRTRPVVITLMSADDGTRRVVTTLKIDLSQSFDLTQFAYLIASGDLPRRYAFRICGTTGRVGWAYGSGSTTLSPELKKRCNITDDNFLYIPGAYTGIGINPVNWIKDNLAAIDAKVIA